MTITEFHLNELELACGVTIEDIQREVPRLMLRDGGATLIVDGTLSPATCSALARFHFGDRDHTYTGINDLGLIVYRLND